MGADYYAKAIIGIELPDEDTIPRAIIKTRKRAFDHDFGDDGETEFHPKDGRKLWLDEIEEVEANYPAYIFDVGEYEVEECDEGQTLIHFPDGTDYAYGTDGEAQYVGFVLETGSSNGGQDEVFSKLPDIEHLKEVLKSILEPIGFWDDDNFGLHVVLYCSY
jgi:hypothetical protein